MKDMDDASQLIHEMGQAAQGAAAALREASAERKHAALIGAAEAVRLSVADILEANAKDLEFGREKGLSDAMMDRLRLTEDRISDIENGLRTVAEQPDPVGSVIADGIGRTDCIFSASARRSASSGLSMKAGRM